MIKYFKLVNKMKISKKMKAKCYLEIILNTIMRIFTYYPFLLTCFILLFFSKILSFIEELFHNISCYSKENICISLLNKNEMEIIKKELKKVLTKND